MPPAIVVSPRDALVEDVLGLGLGLGQRIDAGGVAVLVRLFAGVNVPCWRIAGHDHTFLSHQAPDTRPRTSHFLGYGRYKSLIIQSFHAWHAHCAVIGTRFLVLQPTHRKGDWGSNVPGEE